jgi:hypothetical protein
VLTLDHVVVHCSENADLTRLKGDLAPHGIPFEDGIDIRLIPSLAQGRDFSGCRLENVEIAQDTA